MHPALLLEDLLTAAKAGIPTSPMQLQDLYKTTWKRAYLEGKSDARETCGCLTEA